MSKIIPFKALIPKKEYVGKIICPPYDVIDSKDARAYAKDNPYSFLHVTRPEIDLEEGVNPYSDLVYETANRNLHSFLETRIFQQDNESLYIYELIMGRWKQTGIVAGVSVDEYEKGLIRKHEKTREEKVVDRTNHSMRIKAHAEPVIMVHRESEIIENLVSKEKDKEPLFDVVDKGGVRHILWRAERADDIIDIFSGFDALYIADGHHRSEAALRTRNFIKERERNHLCNFFPAVIFPSNHVRIFEYNWDGPANERPLAKMKLDDIMQLADNGGIMPPKSTWFAPKLTSGLFVYRF